MIAIDNNSNATPAHKVKFPGACKKELKGDVIVWCSSIPQMTERYNDFNRSVITVAGNISSQMGTSIDNQEKLRLGDFLPATADETEWLDTNGDVVPDVKKFYDDIAALELQEISKKVAKYNDDWARMFSKILGQLCPETQANLFRSKTWISIDEERDPGKLMKLLQLVCFSGSDSTYAIESIINSITELVNRKQENNPPVQFSNIVGANMEVVKDMAEIPPGETFFGHIPRIQRFVMEKYPLEFQFKLKDLHLEDETMVQLLHNRCEEVVLGCLITIRSNPSRSDMNVEVHKNMLSSHDAFPLDRVTAIHQLSGYEEFKKRGNNNNVSRTAAKTSGGNTSTGHLADNHSSCSDDDVENVEDVDGEGYIEYVDNENYTEGNDDDSSTETSGVEENSIGRELEYEETRSYHKAKEKYYEAKDKARAKRESATSNTNNG